VLNGVGVSVGVAVGVAVEVAVGDGVCVAVGAGVCVGAGVAVGTTGVAVSFTCAKTAVGGGVAADRLHAAAPSARARSKNATGSKGV